MEEGVQTLAILLAMSCIVLSGPDSASVSFGISEDFSPHTKHESREATCEQVKR